ncbi:MAG TPA: ThuA domain-containing protein, partial [Phycisphaerae bacterium]
MSTTRREVLRAGALGAAAVLASPFLTWAQQNPSASQPGKGKKLLFFTKSQGFPHPAVTRKKKPDGTPVDDLAWGEKYIKDWGTEAGYDVTVSKEGSIFTPENIAKFDCFIFYTTGDLTKPPGTQYDSDKTTAMPVEGKAAFLKAIEDGKGFIGLHSGSDTFENLGNKNDPVRIIPKDVKIDPYCAMLGAEFTSHGSQQPATIRVASKTFPGLEDIKEVKLTEEWYSFTNIIPDLHVILVQDTTTMKTDARGSREKQYAGDPYPETWARMQGKGRVFYTSMGHRDDIWAPATNPLYKKLVLAAMAWTTGLVNADVKSNMAEACPKLWAAANPTAATAPAM